jgi:hypothetical protein
LRPFKVTWLKGMWAPSPRGGGQHATCHMLLAWDSMCGPWEVLLNKME